MNHQVGKDIPYVPKLFKNLDKSHLNSRDYHGNSSLCVSAPGQLTKCSRGARFDNTQPTRVYPALKGRRLGVD